MIDRAPHTIELLAPARDLDAGLAAITSGADAVYIGAGRFGAREEAGNPLPDIERLVRHAHIYWARVYVTINTLLHDHEMDDAVRLIHQLYDLGIDGLIIQDVGLLECDLPPLPLIASTQMHNDRPEKIVFLEKAGFQRVILARELSLEQIVEIRMAAPDIELEFFVHGALCVSYSGQCYMSHALGGRSGNRGQCAQPCRRSYQLVEAAGTALTGRKHLLSLRDLNLSASLTQLLDAGVTAFKIEGRLKDSAYVRNVVAHYRQQLDRILENRPEKKSSSGRTDFDFIPGVDKTFNRDYTSYFLHGRNRLQSRVDTPKHVGVLIGRVAQCKKEHLILQPGALQLHNGDGITFYDSAGSLRGTQVNRADGLKIYPDKMAFLHPGADIYRNHDHLFLAALQKSRSTRKIDVSLTLIETDNGLILAALDEDGIEARMQVTVDKQPALNSQAALEKLQEQLRKSGGTPFRCTEVSVELSQVYHLPLSILNAMRRGVLDNLAEERMQAHPKAHGLYEKNDYPYPENELTFRGNVLNRQAAAFYRRHGVQEIVAAAESGIDLRGQAVMTTRYCLRYELGWCDGRVKKNGPADPLFLVDEDGRRFELEFDCRECRMRVLL